MKTRLAAHVGAPRAAEVYRTLAEAVTAATSPLEGDGYQQVLCFTPESAGAEIAAWFPRRRIEAHSGGDLGERMAHALDQAFRQGASSAVLCLGCTAGAGSSCGGALT